MTQDNGHGNIRPGAVPPDQGYEARLAARLDALRQRDGEEDISKRVQRYAVGDG